MRILNIGLISLCLLTLCACSKAPALRTELVAVSPPALLLRGIPQPEPPADGATNLDLLVYAGELELALAEANNDKRALRENFDQSPRPGLSPP